METKIFQINEEDIDLSKLKVASEVIKNKGLVAFPTETVYGLGANGLDGEAVNKIFAAKGRPNDNPLILHISEKKQVYDLTKEVPIEAEKLINEFWPGPLTVILKRKEIVPNEVTAGLDTVAIRMPDNKIALELIKESGVPIAAPSANSSGKPSPTEASHVAEDLSGKIDIILDGGKVDIGLESTVIDMTRNPSVILRPGKVTKNQIESIIGKLGETKKSDKESPKCPGMKYKHYSPNALVVIIKEGENEEEMAKNYLDKKVRILKYKDEEEMAKNLFKDFRDSDKEEFEIIFVHEVKEEEFGCAIMNRLKKAAGVK